MQAFDPSRTFAENKFVFLAPFLVVVACSGSEDTNFFEPRSGGGTSQSGSGGMVGGTGGMGGSAEGGTTSAGTAGDSGGGGTAGETGGTAGTTGGTDPVGGSAGDGMGGAPMGGSGGQGGDAGSGMSGDGGMAGAGMGGAGMGGAGMAGGGAGGAGMAGDGMGGAGKGGAGKGGAGGSAGCVPTTPSTERCDGVDNNCMGGIDEGNACPAGCTGATREGHYYIFCSFEDDTGGSGSRFRTWPQALDFCTTRMTSLVFIESAEENAFILEWINRMELEDQVWIGANDRDPALGSNEGEWVWGTANNAVQFWDGDEDGEPVMGRFEDWASGEPNNQGNEDCAVLSSDHSFHWDDRVCTNQYLNFICESTAAATTN